MKRVEANISQSVYNLKGQSLNTTYCILDLETTQLTAEYGIPAQNLVHLVYGKGLREASNAEFTY